MIVYGSGKGYVEGVEYHRMGMTNALVSFALFDTSLYIVLM